MNNEQRLRAVEQSVSRLSTQVLVDSSPEAVLNLLTWEEPGLLVTSVDPNTGKSELVLSR